MTLKRDFAILARPASFDISTDKGIGISLTD